MRRRPVAAPARPGGPRTDVPPAPRRHLEPVTVDLLKARWRLALGAAEAALRAGSMYLPKQETAERRKRLTDERDATAELLQILARDQSSLPPSRHVLCAPAEARRLLGLRHGVAACVFNLDGVLVGSAAFHAQAWAETFDELILRRIEHTRGRFTPFDRQGDYLRHIHGKPRLDGVRDLLASRGIRLPEGDPSDPPGTETVHGLANRKNEALQRLLELRPLTAFDGARDYLELAKDAAVRCAVVSASAHTDAILERTRLSALIDASVDGNAIAGLRLPPRPEPDILLEACRRLEVEPGHAAAFETTVAGVAAARTAGFALVVGVDHAGEARRLLAAGADLVVAGLDELLDRNDPR